jgi:hypothetical protein
MGCIVKTILIPIRNIFSKFRFLFALLALWLATASVVVANDILDKIRDSENTVAINQCVKDINQTADDGLDTGVRLYQTGTCYFCIDCDFDADNGKVFSIESSAANVSNELLSNTNYKTAHKLISQAASLGNGEAYYRLAVLTYFVDLSKNPQFTSRPETGALRNVSDDANQAQENVQGSSDNLVENIFQTQHKTKFSSDIHKYLLFSAKQGYVPAQFALSEVYFNGVGVIPDEVQAYAWAATAVAQNPPFGSFRRDEKAINLNEIKLNQAESLAEEYMKKYTNIFDRSSVTVMR